MGFGEAVATGFRKYISGRGRASRSEFWYWTLFTALAGIGGGIIDAIIDANTSAGGYGFVSPLISLVLFIPGVAVAIRRLHDVDRTGWWYLLTLTGIGGIVLLIWFCSRGSPGANRYGLGRNADIAGVFGGGTATLPPAR